MNTIVIDNILATGYLLVWIFTLVWYQCLRNICDSGTVILALNIFYSAIAIISLNDDLAIIPYEPLKVFPYIYLYIMLMVAFMPLVIHHKWPTDKIDNPNTRILYVFSFIIVISSILIIPGLLQNFGTNIVKLFMDSGAGQDAYIEQTKAQADSGAGISNMSSIMYNALQDIGVFLFFYFLTIKEKNKIMTIALGISFTISVVAPVMNGQRTGTINSLLLAVGAYMLFKQYLSKFINKVIRNIGIFTITVTMLPVVAITMSRFGGRAAGVSSFLCWYIGQGSIYFNNHCLDAGGTRNGERICNLPLRLINPDTSQNFVERREKYSYLQIDDNVFSTFVGDFCVDFGPITTVVIFLVFNFWIIRNIRPKGETIKLHQLFLVYFSMAIYIQGAMYLFSYADTGNLRILAMFLFYCYLRYHEKLLERYPLSISVVKNHHLKKKIIYESKSNSIISSTIPSHTRE